jgi:hypothetical protein
MFMKKGEGYSSYPFLHSLLLERKLAYSHVMIVDSGGLKWLGFL